MNTAPLRFNRMNYRGYHPLGWTTTFRASTARMKTSASWSGRELILLRFLLLLIGFLRSGCYGGSDVLDINQGQHWWREGSPNIAWEQNWKCILWPVHVRVNCSQCPSLIEIEKNTVAKSLMPRTYLKPCSSVLAKKSQPSHAWNHCLIEFAEVLSSSRILLAYGPRWKALRGWMCGIYCHPQDHIISGELNGNARWTISLALVRSLMVSLIFSFARGYDTVFHLSWLDRRWFQTLSFGLSSYDSSYPTGHVLRVVPMNKHVDLIDTFWEPGK